MASGPVAEERRDATRRAARGRGVLRGREAGGYELLVHDVSQTGIRFDSLAPLSEGAEVVIELAVVGEKRARVAWKRQCTFGCEFHTPLRHQDVNKVIVGFPIVRLAGDMPESLSMRIVSPGLLAMVVLAAMAAVAWAR